MALVMRERDSLRRHLGLQVVDDRQGFTPEDLAQGQVLCPEAMVDESNDMLLVTLG